MVWFTTQKNPWFQNPLFYGAFWYQFWNFYRHEESVRSHSKSVLHLGMYKNFERCSKYVDNILVDNILVNNIWNILIIELFFNILNGVQNSAGGPPNLRVHKLYWAAKFIFIFYMNTQYLIDKIIAGGDTECRSRLASPRG